MIRALLAVLLCFAALLAVPQLAQAKPPEGISIKAEVGYNGWVQLGRINPVIVDLDNQSAATNLSGDLVLEYNGVEYVTKLDLPTPSRKRLYLYFPCDSYTPYLVLRVRTRGYTESFDLSNVYRTFPAEDLNIVMLTQQSGSLGTVNGQPASRLFRDLYANQVSELGASVIHVAYYNLDQVDPNPKFFTSADAIVLADIDYQQVSPELANVLRACAAGGQGVVFSLGLNGQAVAASPLAGLCPLQAQGTVQVPDLGLFGAQYDLGTDTTATFASGRLLPGAEVAAWAGTQPAIVRQQWGSGYTTALAFDVTAVPFKQNPALAQIFADHVLTLSDSVQVSNWYIHPEQVQDILGQLSEAKPMSPGFVLLFLLTYIVLVGPANFLILSRLKRHTLVWITIPVIIISFGYLGLSTGYLYRGSDNVCAYFQELHVFPHASYTPYQNVMLVFTAERTNYTLEVPDRSAFIYPDIPAVIYGPQFGGGGGGLRGMSGGQVDDTDQPKITTTQGKWTQKTYFYQGYQNLAGSVDSALAAERDQSNITDISGSFTVDLPYELYDCRLVAPGQNIYIGDLEQSATIDLAVWQADRRTRLNQYDDYLTGARGRFAELANSAAELGLVYRDEALLIGFTKDLSALAEFKRPHEEYLLSMVVVHLPIETRVPDSGTARIARWRLLGGKGFKLQERYWEQSVRPEMRQYSMERDGYLDIAYQVAGKINSTTALSLLVNATRSSMRGETITDLNAYLDAAGRVPGGWQPIAVPSSDYTIYTTVSGLVDENREVVIRIRALDECVLELPRPSM